MSEQTYRNPLFGQRVDRYIPPELRQGLGAVLALGDMLNPVSAYREYLKAVNEEDYTDAAVEAAGILAPGVAGKLVKPAVRAAGPYIDDATKAMMEVFLPTGAPDVAPRMVGGVEDFGRGLGSVEIGVEDFGFRQDNPAVSRGATDWLANKQRIADEDYENFRGISGSITAELGQRRDSPMFLPTEFLRSLPGARGESRGPGDPRFDDLLATVRREGFDPEQAGNRVVVGVNHRGEAFIVEGNTRTAVADVVGIPSVKAEVRYFNGGEEVAGPFAPSSIARIAASRSD